LPYLRTIEIDVDSIDELVLILKESEQNDMLRRIGLARKHVTALLRLLTDKADIIKIFIKRLSTLSPKSETLLYLSDVQDHVITMVKNLSHYDKTLTRAHSNYLAQITIEITLTANRTNDIVMKMTALGSVFLPLNVITGKFIYLIIIMIIYNNNNNNNNINIKNFLYVFNRYVGYERYSSRTVIR